MSITVKINTHLAQDIAGAVKSGMTNLVAQIESRAVKEAPVKTANLVRKITSDVSSDGTKGVVTSGASYSRYVHEGTGLFGPQKKPIVPTTKKALFWPGAKHPVKSVKGMRPNPFFARALSRVNAQDTFDEGVGNYLRRNT